MMETHVYIIPAGMAIQLKWTALQRCLLWLPPITDQTTCGLNVYGLRSVSRLHTHIHACKERQRWRETECVCEGGLWGGGEAGGGGGASACRKSWGSCDTRSQPMRSKCALRSCAGGFLVVINGWVELSAVLKVTSWWTALQHKGQRRFYQISLSLCDVLSTIETTQS